MYAELAIKSLQRFELVLQRSRNRAVNGFQNLDDTLQLFHSFFEIEKFLWCDNHASVGYSNLIGLEPRIEGASGNTGLSTDVGNAFSALMAQDEFPLLFGCIFHTIFLLNVG